MEIIARREGTQVARYRFGSAIGSLTVDLPLGVVQIDHTLVDVIVVDSATRSPSNGRGSRSRLMCARAV